MLPSPDLAHLPFLFWLMETARPSVCLQVGLKDYVAFLGLCQSAERLATDSICLGAPSGADAADTVALERLQAWNSYADISAVIPLEELQQVGDRIDLLVVLGPIGREERQLLEVEVLPRMSDGGLIVVLGGHEENPRDEARQWCRELKAKWPSFSSFGSETRLDFFMLGEGHAQALKTLTALNGDMAGTFGARQVFRRLGQGLHDQIELQRVRQDLEKAEETLEALRDRIEAQDSEIHNAWQAEGKLAESLKKALDNQEQSLDKLRKAEEIHAVELTSSLKAIDAERAKGEALAKELQALRGMLAAAKSEIEEHETTHTREALEVEKSKNRDLGEELQGLKEALETVRAEAAEYAAAHADAREALEVERARGDGLQEDSKLLRNQVKETERRHGDRIEDLAALTGHYEQLLQEQQKTGEVRAEEFAEALQAWERKHGDLFRRMEEKSKQAKASYRLLEQENLKLSQRFTEKDAKLKQAVRSLADAEKQRYRTDIIRRLLEKQIRMNQILSRPSWSTQRRQLMAKAASEAQVISRSSLFDSIWYRSTYPDLKDVADTKTHYVLQGCFEGRNPSPDFDTIEYCMHHPDALKTDTCPLVHHLQGRDSLSRSD